MSPALDPNAEAGKTAGRRRLPTSPALGLTERQRQKRKRLNKRAREKRHARRRPFVKAAWTLLRFLPLPVAALFGEMIGLLAWWFWPDKRARVIAHVDEAYGDELSERERRRIARRSMQLMGRGLLSLIVLHRMGKRRTLERLEIVGDERVRDAIRDHGSCVLVCAHYGLFELAAVYTSDAFQSRSVGMDAAPDSPTEQLIGLRKDLGVETIQRGDPRPILRELRAGRPVGLVVDHDLEHVNGVFVPFFGKLAHTAIGPARIAMRMKVPVIPVVTEWAGLTRHRIRFLPSVHAREDLPDDVCSYEMTARFTRLIEDQIRARPEHWMWIHKRWRTRPEARPELPVFTGEPEA